MMVGRLLSLWDGKFSGAMLNFEGVRIPLNISLKISLTIPNQIQEIRAANGPAIHFWAFRLVRWIAPHWKKGRFFNEKSTGKNESFWDATWCYLLLMDGRNPARKPPGMYILFLVNNEIRYQPPSTGEFTGFLPSTVVLGVFKGRKVCWKCENMRLGFGDSFGEKIAWSKYKVLISVGFQIQTIAVQLFGKEAIESPNSWVIYCMAILPYFHSLVVSKQVERLWNQVITWICLFLDLLARSWIRLELDADGKIVPSSIFSQTVIYHVVQSVKKKQDNIIYINIFSQ